LGEAGSGKSHIEEVAMSLIPNEFIVNEKNITQAALFRRAEQSEYFYDGKIVNYGDMGGSNDQEFMEESKNIMKELQSEGFVSKPVATKVDGAWETRELKLIGKPCLTYTTVPNYEFDDQELSRSILVTPRTDNKREFNRRNRALEFKGKSYGYMMKMVQESEQIQYMVYLLRDTMKDTVIINPYVDVVIGFLKNSEYYKRDFPKYNNLLKVITAFNYYHKQVYEKEDGVKVLYVSAEDVQLFLTLLSKYELSISENLSLHATDIIKELMELEKQTPIGDDGQPTLDVNATWTINDFMEHTKLNLAKRSVQNYFKELNSRGFVRVVEKKNNANVYELTGAFSMNLLEETLTLSQSVKETIAYELGDELLAILEDDKPVKGLSIMDHDDNVRSPNW
jgi:ABC-type dipeptide/oligopeptide/nickel transport system ATPase component